MAGQSALYGLAGALGKGLGLLTVPILTRLLSPAEYGLADLANTLAAMLAMLAMFAGDIPASRLAGTAATAASRTSVLSTYVWTTAALSAGIAALLMPLSGVIASRLWASPDSGGVALLAIVLIPISTVQASLVTTQRIELRPTRFAVLATVDLLAQMILAVLFVLLGWGAAGIVAGYVLGSLVGLATALHSAHAIVRVRPIARLGWEMLVEGLFFLPATLGFVVATYVVRFLLVIGPGQEAVGLFGVAFRLASGMALLTGAFSMAWGPYGLALPQGPSTSRLFGQMGRLFAIGGSLVAIALGALGPELVATVSGGDYARSATMLPGLLAATAMSGTFYVFLVAAGITQRGRSVAIAAVVGAVGQVVITALLLGIMGLWAVGAGAVAGQALALLMLASSIRRSIHEAFSTMLIMGVGGLACLGIQSLNMSAPETQAIRWVIAVLAGFVALALVISIWRRAPRRFGAEAGMR